MYHNIAASIRSKVLLRGSSSSLATSFVALPLNYPTYNAPSHQASLSMSMFATVGSASGDGSSSSSNEQRRPFWATRPIENEATTTTKTPPNPSINTVDHSLNAAAASAGISMDDIKKAVTKAKKPDSLESIVKGAPKKTTAKPKKAKKEKEEEDNDEEEEVEDEDEATVDDEEEEEDIKLPPHPDSITPTYMAKVIAAKHKKHAVTAALAKRIIDDIFDMVIDVRTLHKYIIFCRDDRC